MTDARQGDQIAKRETSTSQSTEPAYPTLAPNAVPRWAVIGIFLLLLVAGITYARQFLIPVVLAFLLALVFSPVRRFLERRVRLPAGVSALLILSGLITLLLTVLTLLAEPVQQLIQDAPKIGNQLEQKLRTVAGPARAMVEAGEQVDKITSGAQVAKIAPTPGKKPVQEVVVREPGFTESLAIVAPAILTQAVFTLVLLFFILASGDMLYEKIVHVMPTLEDKRRAIRIAFDIERKLSRYLFTITVINAGLGVAIGTAMWLIGLPNPMLFGVLAFAMNYIPYLGAIVGSLIAAVFGLITFDDVSYAVLPGLVYFTLTSLEGQFITPHLVGRRLEMNTVVVFISVALWAWLWSVMGMLVAVPLLVTIHAFCEHIPQLQPIGDFLSARGRESADPADEKEAQREAARPSP